MKIPRSRSLRRMKVKLPGGRITIHYKKRRPSKSRDPFTKKILHGVPNLIPSKLRKLPKTKRRPNRPYGGVLSPSEMRKTIINKSKIKEFPLQVGRLVVKTAGRDAGKIGVIVDLIDNKTVLIDGQVRRRKCNISHLETLDQTIKIKQKATTDTIIKEFKALNIEVKKTKPKARKEKPKKSRKIKEKKQPTPEKKLKKEKPKKEKPKAKAVKVKKKKVAKKKTKK